MEIQGHRHYHVIYIYIYIYIYCHPQTGCFVLSELFSVIRHVGRSKPGSKPIYLYVRLSFRPLGQQAYHQGIFFKVLCSNSSSRLFTFVYSIDYQSAQFFRRALHYASGKKNPSPECSTELFNVQLQMKQIKPFLWTVTVAIMLSQGSEKIVVLEK